MLRDIGELFAYHFDFAGRFADHDAYNVFRKTVRDLSAVDFGALRGKGC
jgi:hypothetical protein